MVEADDPVVDPVVDEGVPVVAEAKQSGWLQIAGLVEFKTAETALRSADSTPAPAITPNKAELNKLKSAVVIGILMWTLVMLTSPS